MVQQILTLIIALYIFVYIKFVFLPKRKIIIYKKKLQALGYKVKLYPIKPFSLSIAEQFIKDQKQHGDSYYTLKSQESYQADIIIHNILSNFVVEFVNIDLVKQQYSPQKVYNQKKLTYMFQNMIAFFGLGLVWSQGDVWKVKRRVLSSVFNFQFIKNSIPKMIQACNQQLQKFQKECDKKQKPYKKYLLHLNSNILASILIKCFFGSQMSSESFKGKSTAAFFSQLFNLLMIQSRNPLGFILGQWIFKLGFTKVDRKINNDTVLFRKVATQFVKNRYNQIKSKEIQQKSNDLIEALYKQGMISQGKDKKQQQYDFQQLIDQFCHFYGAGTDTTGHTFMATIYFLALNPQLNKKVRNQIDKYIKDQSDITYQNLKQIVYLDWLKNQVVRFAGPVGFIFWRQATKDQLVGNIPVSKGTYVGAMSVPSHFNPKYYKNPEQFRPERWEKQCNDLPPYAFCGFGGGPRSCLGKSLSYLQSKVMLIQFLRRYKEVILPVKKLEWTFGSAYEPVQFQTQFIKN